MLNRFRNVLKKKKEDTNEDETIEYLEPSASNESSDTHNDSECSD
jgi:hypothetical protein